MNSFAFRHLFCPSIGRQFFLPMKLPINSTLSLAVLAGISLVTPGFAVTIDSVLVGNINNANDAATGSVYGAVAYAYKIAKNETTISQYAEFLNAAAKTDSYGLYSASMTTSYINGISRSGSSGTFTYSVNPGSANKPITYVSWFDAARFCNWLQNGQQTGAGAGRGFFSVKMLKSIGAG
jgi:hypothetical protein